MDGSYSAFGDKDSSGNVWLVGVVYFFALVRSAKGYLYAFSL